jgi:hypothetical protein
VKEAAGPNNLFEQIFVILPHEKEHTVPTHDFHFR